MNGFGPLVSAGWLAEHLGDPDVRVIDFRWYLAGRRGADEYARGHIPGAVFVDMEAMPGRPGGPGRHPIPTAATFTQAMRAAGVSMGTKVVAYDDGGASPAAPRLWWLLRHFGHRQAAVLDGGLGAWRGGLTTEAPKVEPGDFTAAPAAPDTIGYDEVRARAGSTVVLDARAPERYRGDVEPIDPRAGHIPGALSAPFSGNLDQGGRFLDAVGLRERYAALGVRPGTPVVVYCGSGVTAAHDVLALELIGHGDVLLYEGSWSDWSSREDAPAATGSEP